ncbi:secreted cysteine protease, peptidase C25 family [Psychroflexus torquis ATCC 700755]|uniref:Secreted cysteine protease, peptidase C25 family n=1 Tax=Psychroflexus torquis (strain ATCC 700755 / CIP 106069 / ACAM 623) TaxID=313595 RepID=K4IFV7_PSYTT|nr:type IX secretion system sortase PorU [Psychroflexus torquis]AFU69269.1 secreted cysteine protease, peptidase C25 family [Psychroflexus torquis ATCC 700755]
MKFFITLSFLFIYFIAASQVDKVNINWRNDNKIAQSSEENIDLSQLDANYFDYDDGRQSLNYTHFFNLNSINYRLSNVQSVVVSEKISNQINSIPDELSYKFKLAQGPDFTKLALILNPFYSENNSIYRIVSFEIVPSATSQSSATINRNENLSRNTSAVSNSIFNGGNISKFYVNNTGAHRLDFSFLRSLGITESNIPSSNLKIFGHGGGMLPLVNQDNLYFDPPELSIQVIDGGDGVFNSGDYILFYATNTEGWSEESETNLNLYADRSYYYLTVNSSGGKRMSTLGLPVAAATTTITEFDDYQFYEVDETSLSLVGRKWFGDRFDVETERTYEFAFPNLVQSESIQLNINLGAISPLRSSFTVSINGQPLNSPINLSATRDNNPSSGAQFLTQVNSSNDEVTIQLTYNKNGNPGARGFLDYISLEARRDLIASEVQFKFKNTDVSTLPGVGEYLIQNSSGVDQVWDITDPINPSFISNPNEANTFSFKSPLGSAKEFQAVTSTYFSPSIEFGNEQVPRQNLKGSILTNAQGQFQDIDYLIVTRSDFMSAANRLAQYRRDTDGLVVKTVTVEDIYEEFNSGKQDIGAIRNFVKYIYDNASSPANRIKFLGLIGDASVDYKNRLQGNTNIVPTYQSLGSFSTTVSSFMSDDYFVMMDPSEGQMGSGELMDLAVGRILADTPQRANAMVDKIISSEQKESYAQWRNNFVLISDDADDSNDYGLQVDLDNLGDEISANKPTVNVKKIHSDAFQQVTSAGGNRYPEVNRSITDAIEVGAAVVNYFGHGGEDGLAQERIVTQTNTQDWRNPARFNCFVTITCEFTKFDNPLRMTGGELTFWNEDGGAVSLVTTTRAISVFAGVQFNNVFAPFLFDFSNNNETIAQSVARAKQDISGNGKRIVFFVGDPAMKLPLPKSRVQLSSINDISIGQFTDTLQALGKYKFKGQILNANNQRLQEYKGDLSVIVFDKRIDRQTLGNDGARRNGELAVLDFTTLGESLFRGQASVVNGEFEFEFVLPKDTRLPVDKGRVSLYSSSENQLEEYSGFNTDILIGGLNEDAPEDNQGPLINLYMNDENFVNGGITDNQPFIFALLEDENGINTAGGIGHDIIAILDGDESNPIVLNEYYEAEQDDFTNGKVYFRLRDLEDGEHTLSFKAWDVYNNSQTQDIQFVVAGEDELKITRVLNYPNPFIDYTEFWFNHNRPFEPLEVMVQVFTVTGKLVWTQNQIANTNGFLFRDLSWNGRDDFGNKIGKGVYVYKLTVKSTLTQQKVEKYEKLVIL